MQCSSWCRHQGLQLVKNGRQQLVLKYYIRSIFSIGPTVIDHGIAREQIRHTYSSIRFKLISN